MELVSVIMSIYNEPIEYVQKSIKSILLQSYKNLEIIIVVDNPENSTVIAYLKTIKSNDERVKLFINERNIGLAMSLNRAISNSNGIYLARMDADDISKPERIEEELAFLEKHNCDVVSSLVDKIDENDCVWGEVKKISDKRNAENLMLPYQNIIVHPTVVMKADVIKNHGGYRNFSSCQDYDLWLRLLSDGCTIRILNKKLLYFRKHKNSITSSKRYSQIVNEIYIRQLYKERLNSKNSRDSFSERNLFQFQKQYGMNNPQVLERENDFLYQYQSGIKKIKTRHCFKGCIEVADSLRSEAVRKIVYTSLIGKAMRLRIKYSRSF